MAECLSVRFPGPVPAAGRSEGRTSDRLLIQIGICSIAWERPHINDMITKNIVYKERKYK